MIDVCAREDLREGEIAIVRAGRREIGVLLWRGRVHALANRCPHMGAPACRGSIRALVGGAAGWDLSCTEDEPVLACPWHGWEFRVGDGVAVADPRYRIRRYRTEVREGRVLVEVRG